jgi:hypothetical protein
MPRKTSYDNQPFVPPPGTEPTRAQIAAAKLVRQAQEVQSRLGKPADGIVAAAERAKTLSKMPAKYRALMNRKKSGGK